jgi:pyruvate formate lyase activating enzyme
MGYCGVRGVVDGALHTFNYGLSLTPTEECIETEAVVHYRPGSRILSLGNIGCMMNCIFCQNWETSQIEYLDPGQIRTCTPEQIIEVCRANDIDVISWTYNDPVVWQEFVVATSRLAQQNGLLTVYKSAFYIEEEPVRELIDCIDVFSLSLKSVSDDFYRNATGARLEPVLSRIRQVAQSNRHLEISYLVIPGLNDRQEDISAMLDWVLANVGDLVPLHLVAFHPAYRYTTVERTGLELLLTAREMAQKRGIRHVYLGNTHAKEVSDTICAGCGAVLVQRFGLIATPRQIDAAGCCTICGERSPISKPLDGVRRPLEAAGTISGRHRLEFRWHNEANGIHVIRSGGAVGTDRLKVQSLDSGEGYERTLADGLDRFIVARSDEHDSGVVISWDSDNQYRLAPLLDRAHFPVESSIDGNGTGHE